MIIGTVAIFHPFRVVYSLLWTVLFDLSSCKSYQSILAEILSTNLGIANFSWVACLACTELEPVILDRLDHIMSLPIAFLSFNSNNVNETETSNITIECQSICSAGGVVLGSESECILVTMLAIKTKKNGKQTIRKSFNGKWTNII
ncbi:unnamed protein product [Rotaria sordida]|uniref:Uncharacterized protein n=1 Tax=Rotaria sordida TaxID=392033 RepID=A0A814QGF1_9BILA|nr:unnamed protein product [Rotaria sordida]